MKNLFLGTDPRAALVGLFGCIYDRARAEALAETLLCAYGSLSRLLLIDLHTLEENIGREAALYLSLSLRLCIGRTTDRLRAGDTLTPAVLVRHFSALYANEGKEAVYLVLLDNEERLLATVRASVGAADGSGLLPRQALEIALRAGAKAVYLTHNHPGGDLNPSDSDLKITAAVQASLEAARIRFLGHYIFSRGEYVLVGDTAAEGGTEKTKEFIKSEIR